MTNYEILKRIYRDIIINIGKTKIYLITIIGLLVSFLGYLEPMFFTQVIKIIEIFLKNGIFETSVFIKTLVYWGLFIVISISASLIYRYHFVEKNGLKNFINITSIYSEKIINMTYPTYLSKEVGAIYKIFDRGTENQFNLFHFIFLDLVKSLGGVVLISIILFYNNYIMTLIALSLLPIMVLFGILFYKKLFLVQKKLDKKWDAIYSDIGNIMSVFSLVKTLGVENTFTKKINNKLVYCNEEQLKISKGWTISDLYTGFFTTISRFLVLMFGVYFIINGQITFATLFLFFSYIGWIYFPIGFLFSRLGNVQAWLTSIGNFYEEFDNLENEYKNDLGKKIKKIDGKIEFENVNFGYGEKNVLKNLNFKVKKGEKIAFVGNTGAGKSTIVNLLLRFWKTDNGNILLDGININDINLKSLRQHIGVVSQDNSLFNLSIKENLLFANPNANQKDLENALRKAEAGYVFELKNGINTIIGERGLKLSGGEKQRLSIARLFLKNPKILILDEATSALDNKTEKLIQKALDKLMKGRTSIVIAHRLSTIKNSDIIFLMKNGKIIEKGNYYELNEKKGHFHKLVNPESFIIT